MSIPDGAHPSYTCLPHLVLTNYKSHQSAAPSNTMDIPKYGVHMQYMINFMVQWPWEVMYIFILF